ncbi:SRPBCC family protein [Rickettsiales bacterium LUAb2]
MIKEELNINPKLDLILERTLDVNAKLVWKAWTEAQNLPKWFCPKPWRVDDCKIDLKSGGIFSFTMYGPAGEIIPNQGCFLEITTYKKLVWTSALTENYRPSIIGKNNDMFFFTAKVLIEAIDDQTTKYVAIAMHDTKENREKHEKMGFHEGWGICCDQLVNEIKKGNIK